MNWSYLKLLARRILLLLLAYFLLRVVFLFWNRHEASVQPLSELLFAFVHGVRFDLSTIALLHFPFILFSLLPFEKSKNLYSYFLKILFFVPVPVILLLCLSDSEYFAISGRRLSLSLLGIQQDIQHQLPQLISYYWKVVLSAIVGSYLLFRFYPRVHEQPSSRAWNFKNALVIFGVFCVGVFLNILALRGGVQIKPLHPTHAYIASKSSVVGSLTLNGPFHVIHTRRERGVDRMNYFPETEDLRKYFRPAPNPKRHKLASGHGHNVVLFILESYGLEYMGIGNPYPGYSPFLDSLAKKGAFFRNHFANGKSSIEAPPSILASIPSFFSSPYITSIYNSNKIKGIGELFRQNGYETSFYHGGQNGTMFFDVFSRLAGIESYYGLNEYPNKNDYDGAWGVPDEIYLEYCLKEFRKKKKPFFATVFTLSSHPPYYIPEKYKGKFPKGDVEIHESIGYTDYSISQFFKNAEKEPWFKNTLFVFTADHTQKNKVPFYATAFGKFNVPLFFYHPSVDLSKVDTSKVANHVDIQPSILDFVGLPQNEVLPFGHSLFDESAEGLVLQYQGDAHRIANKKHIVKLTPQGQLSIYDFTKDWNEERALPGLETEKDRLGKQLKAYIQFFNNGIMDNSWFSSSKTVN